MKEHRLCAAAGLALWVQDVMRFTLAAKLISYDSKRRASGCTVYSLRLVQRAPSERGGWERWERQGMSVSRAQGCQAGQQKPCHTCVVQHCWLELGQGVAAWQNERTEREQHVSCC